MADPVHGEHPGGNDDCIDCGGLIALCLVRLGSLRCHDCRETVTARMSFAPVSNGSRFRAFLHAPTAALGRLTGR
jgi:hypothetical protein